MSEPHLPEKSTIDRLRPIPFPGWLRAGFGLAEGLAPGAAARMARRIFFTPPPSRVRPEQQDLLDRAQRFELETPDGPVVGWSWGQGETVLLVHGWVATRASSRASSSRSSPGASERWRSTCPAMAARGDRSPPCATSRPRSRTRASCSLPSRGSSRTASAARPRPMRSAGGSPRGGPCSWHLPPGSRRFSCPCGAASAGRTRSSGGSGGCRKAGCA